MTCKLGSELAAATMVLQAEDHGCKDAASYVRQVALTLTSKTAAQILVATCNRLLL